MDLQVPEYIQVVFHLIVRKGDLSPLSQTQQDTLIQTMDSMRKAIIEKGYLANLQVHLDGVTI